MVRNFTNNQIVDYNKTLISKVNGHGCACQCQIDCMKRTRKGKLHQLLTIYFPQTTLKHLVY